MNIGYPMTVVLVTVVPFRPFNEVSGFILATLFVLFKCTNNLTLIEAQLNYDKFGVIRCYFYLGLLVRFLTNSYFGSPW